MIGVLNWYFCTRWYKIFSFQSRPRQHCFRKHCFENNFSLSNNIFCCSLCSDPWTCDTVGLRVCTSSSACRLILLLYLPQQVYNASHFSSARKPARKFTFVSKQCFLKCLVYEYFMYMLCPYVQWIHQRIGDHQILYINILSNIFSTVWMLIKACI